MSNYDIRANLSVFMQVFNLILMAGAFFLLREFFLAFALGLLVGNGLAIIAHRLLFPQRWIDHE